MKQLKLANSSTVTIREAIKSDAGAVLVYIDTISSESDFLTFGKGEFDKTIEQEADFIDSVSSQNNSLFLVAEINKKVIGNLTFSGGDRPRIEHSGELGVGVIKEYCGQGIGTELMKYLIEWSKKSGVIRKVNLRVRSDNYTAIHIYEKLGFIENGIVTRDFLIRDSFYDSVLMGLEID